MQLLEKPKINLAAVRTNANMNQREWAKALCVEMRKLFANIILMKRNYSAMPDEEIWKKKSEAL